MLLKFVRTNLNIRGGINNRRFVSFVRTNVIKNSSGKNVGYISIINGDRDKINESDIEYTVRSNREISEKIRDVLGNDVKKVIAFCLEPTSFIPVPDKKNERTVRGGHVASIVLEVHNDGVEVISGTEISKIPKTARGLSKSPDAYLNSESNQGMILKSQDFNVPAEYENPENTKKHFFGSSEILTKSMLKRGVIEYVVFLDKDHTNTYVESIIKNNKRQQKESTEYIRMTKACGQAVENVFGLSGVPGSSTQEAVMEVVLNILIDPEAKLSFKTQAAKIGLSYYPDRVYKEGRELFLKLKNSDKDDEREEHRADNETNSDSAPKPNL